MFKTQKSVSTLSLAIVMLFSMSFANAALVAYDIEGTVMIGDEFFPNAFGLTAGETILATGTFDDSILGAGTNTASFTGTIDVNGTFYTSADASVSTLTFTDGSLVDFNFVALDSSFNSNFLEFDDFSDMAGQWGAVTISPVPVPAAVWLFGSGLLGLAGIARRKTV